MIRNLVRAGAEVVIRTRIRGTVPGGPKYPPQDVFQKSVPLATPSVYCWFQFIKRVAHLMAPVVMLRAMIESAWSLGSMQETSVPPLLMHWVYAGAVGML